MSRCIFTRRFAIPLAFIVTVLAANFGHANDRAWLSRVALSFEANQGQAGPEVKFLSRGRDASLLLTEDGAVLKVRFRDQKSNDSDKTAIIHTTLLGAQPASLRGIDKLPGISNHFIGRDPSQWVRNVSHYARIEYTSAYPGIDLVYYGTQSQVEYDFRVQPGSNPDVIRMRIDGAQLHVNHDGELVLSTAYGDVLWRKPVAYQEDNGQRREIAAAYEVSGNEVGFKLGNYDHGSMLIVDPPLVWGTFLGGSNDESAVKIAVDAGGNTVVAGNTMSANFPTAPGAYQSSLKGNSDIFVSKINQDGTALLWSTFVGGSSEEVTYGLAVDREGSAYVVGNTVSTDFPTTPGSYYPNGSSSFLFKLSAGGDSLAYSTFSGGPAGVSAFDVAVDSAGAAYVAGVYNSAFGAYPFTPGAYRNQYVPGKNYISIMKFNPAGSALDYALLIGSSSGQYPSAIAVTPNGEAVITGHIYMAGYPQDVLYPITAGEPSGTADGAIVSRFNSAGTALIFSAVLDSGWGLGVGYGPSNNVAVTGFAGTRVPTTANAYRRTFPSSGSGIKQTFLTEMSSTGQILYSTYLGGNIADNIIERGNAIAVDSSGIINLVGTKYSDTFPVTDSTYTAKFCEYLARFNPTLSGSSSLVYSGCTGATGTEADVALDTDDAVHVLGESTGPTSMNAFQPFSHFGNINSYGYLSLGPQPLEAWIGKFDFNTAPAPGVTVNSPLNGSVTTTGRGVHYVAGATTSCPGGVSAMAVYTAPHVRPVVVNGAHLDAWIGDLSAGSHGTVVQEWDNCGGSAKTPITVQVLPASVKVSSPVGVVSSPVHYVATASSPWCAQGIVAMRIYTAPHVDAYDTGGSSLDTYINLPPGNYDAGVVQAWDACGNVFWQAVPIQVK